MRQGSRWRVRKSRLSAPGNAASKNLLSEWKTVKCLFTECISVHMKKAEYMSYHLGEEFTGIISGITGYGLYVELDNTVEGMVHISALTDDYYSFDQEKMELKGEMTKKIYHLGQRVKVRTVDADALKRTVDFVLVQEAEREDSDAEENRNQTDRKQ